MTYTLYYISGQTAISSDSFFFFFITISINSLFRHLIIFISYEITKPNTVNLIKDPTFSTDESF